MCVINLPIQSVSSTKILIAQCQLADNKRLYQLVSYGNKIALDPRVTKPNAMILPVPCKKEEIVVEDSKSPWADNLFKALWKSFDDLKPKSRGFGSFGAQSYSSSSKGFLQVNTAGSYQYSIAGSKDELENFNPSVFSLSPECRIYMRKHYPEGFSFLILQLAASGEYHPFTYLHPICETKKMLFIPTRHFHASHDIPSSFVTSFMGSVFPKPGILVPPPYQNSQEYGDYDHEIYLFNTGQPLLLDNRTLSDAIINPDPGDLVQHSNFKQVERFFDIIRPHLPLACQASFNGYSLMQWTVEGTKTNGDFWVATALPPLVWSDDKTYTFCDGCDMKPIVGNRYRCLLCPCFDLCQDCFDKQTKHDTSHPMVAFQNFSQYASMERITLSKR